MAEKSLRILRFTSRENLDPSRGGLTNTPGACGDDDCTCAINRLDRKPPSAMMMIHPSDRPLFKKVRFLMRADSLLPKMGFRPLFRARLFAKLVFPS